MTRPFLASPVWASALKALGASPATVLRDAHLPRDLFRQPRPLVDPDGFRTFWQALDVWPAPGLALGTAATATTFTPGNFAALCSPDLTAASHRLAAHAPMTGPVVLEVHAMGSGLELTFGGNEGVALPDQYVAAELAHIVHIARLGTGQRVRPVAVEMVAPPKGAAFTEFFGRAIRTGPFNRVVFAPADARRAFQTPDRRLFARFPADLRPHPKKTDLKTALLHLLPAGQGDIALAARAMSLTPRTLQRRLKAEHTGFQTELAALRQRLAEHYLSATALSLSEIAFLLDYDDPNSFFRAFRGWTGTTPEAFRAA